MLQGSESCIMIAMVTMQQFKINDIFDNIMRVQQTIDAGAGLRSLTISRILILPEITEIQ